MKKDYEEYLETVFRIADEDLDKEIEYVDIKVEKNLIIQLSQLEDIHSKMNGLSLTSGDRTPEARVNNALYAFMDILESGVRARMEMDDHE